MNKSKDSIKRPYPSPKDYYSDNDLLHKNCNIEACLSIPDMNMSFARYDKITVEYQNEDGVKKIENKSGYLSKLFQHELDHLNGITVANRIISTIHSKKGGIHFPAIENVSEENDIRSFVENREMVFKYLYEYMINNILCNHYINKPQCDKC